MHSSLALHPDVLARTCQRYGVQRLELFGSGAGPDFDPSRSDVDLIVDFSEAARPMLFERCFGLKHDLEALWGRSVDLVMAGGSCDRLWNATSRSSARPCGAWPVQTRRPQRCWARTRRSLRSAMS